LFGPLPAYGIWARHVTGLTVSNVSLSFLAADTRPAVVLDDVRDSVFQDFTAGVAPGVPVFVEVTNTMKRPADLEYVPNLAYSTDTVSNVTLPPGLAVQQAIVNRPAVGTPPDMLYKSPTVPSAAHPFYYSSVDPNSPYPVTVHPPFFGTIAPSRFYRANVGEQLRFSVQAYSPSSGSEIAAAQTGLTYSTGTLPGGATFNSRVFTWTPTEAGVYRVQFIVSDGVISESKTVTISVGNPILPVANPGPSRRVPLGSLVTLDGSGSQDPASATPQLPAWWTLSFSWVQTAGPAVTLGSGDGEPCSGPKKTTFRFLFSPVGRNWRWVLANDGYQRKSSQKLQFGDQ
jgi:Ca2+-binding RTX toxin-like protein